MPEDKFDELDRRRVIREVENELGLRLSRSGRRRILWCDDTGNPFVVVGGSGDWHGLPKQLVEHLQEGTLVIAKLNRDECRIYAGPLRPLLDNTGRLHVHNSGNFSFNVAWRRDYATIKEIPGANLSLLCEFKY